MNPSRILTDNFLSGPTHTHTHTYTHTHSSRDCYKYRHTGCVDNSPTWPNDVPSNHNARDPEYGHACARVVGLVRPTPCNSSNPRRRSPPADPALTCTTAVAQAVLLSAPPPAILRAAHPNTRTHIHQHAQSAVQHNESTVTTTQHVPSRLADNRPVLGMNPVERSCQLSLHMARRRH